MLSCCSLFCIPYITVSQHAQINVFVFKCANIIYYYSCNDKDESVLVLNAMITRD